MSIDKNDDPDQRSDAENNQDTVKTGFSDVSGTFPKTQYFFGPSTNRAARSKTRNELNMGGGYAGLSMELPPSGESRYPYNDVNETLSGHVIEFDDTPGAERILIKHNSGSGVELRVDGSIAMKSESNMVTSVAGSSVLIVEGEADMRFNGNLNLTVAGDLNLNVGGNINTNVGGDHKTDVGGAMREKVYGAKGSIVKGSRSSTTVGTQTDTVLGGANTIVKGDSRHTIQGNHTQGVSGTTKMTAESEMIISTANMNLAASDLSIFGAVGTIGGAGIVHYGTTYYGATFHGDLQGTALQAVTADSTNSQPYAESAVGSASGWTANNVTTATAQASAGLMDAYLNQSAYGTIKVTIDEGDFLKNLIDRTTDNGGVSDRDLSTTEIRSKLRDPASLGNDVFVGNAVAAGKISPRYSQSIPGGVNRMSNTNSQVRTPSRPITKQLNSVSRYKTSKNTDVNRFIPNPAYNPNMLGLDVTVDGSIQLGKGISLAKFLGGTGEKVTLAHITTHEAKLQIARQFALHASAMDTVSSDRGEFKNYRLVVVEGLYKKGPQETLTVGSHNDLATTGRTVVYELHNSSGKVDLTKTYNLALYWKDSILYDKLSLSYDSFDPKLPMTAQIILTMPEVDASFNIINKRYKNELETLYNNKVQSSELIEVTTD